MARIMVSGYIETDDLSPEDVDLGHEMGVSSDFYDAITSGQRTLPMLEDIEFELQED